MSSVFSKSISGTVAWSLWRHLAAVVLLMLGSWSLGGQSMEVRVFFPFDSAALRPDYLDNSLSFSRLDSLITARGACSIDSLQVVSYSSPEGDYRYNVRLSERRARALRDYIVGRWPELDGRVSICPEGESWAALREAVLHDERLSTGARDGMLDVIDSDLAPDAKERRLAAMPIYRYLYSSYFRRLRYAYVSVAPMVVQVPEVDLLSLVSDIPDEPLETDLDAPAVEAAPALSVPYIKWPLMAVSTNLLYDAAATPNFAIEIPIGQRWSVYGEYTFPWWLTKANDRAWQILKWDIGARRYLSHHNPADRMDILSGHFVGVDFGAGYYDIEPRHKGYQGEFQMASLEYGYAWTLGRRWRLDACIGAGWMGTHYRYYEADEGDVHLVYQHNGKFTWFGPTKAALSVKYIFTTVKKSVR